MQEASCPSVLLDVWLVRLSNFTSVTLAHFLNKTKKLMLIARRKTLSEEQNARSKMPIRFVRLLFGPSV